MGSTFNHTGNYICECGKEFSNSQKYNGHIGHCKVHMKNKLGEKFDDFYKEYIESSTSGLKKWNEREKENKLKSEEEQLNQWISEKHYCERCGKLMLEKFGPGRFCSRSCANSRAQTSHQNLLRRRKLTLRKNNSSRHIECFNNYVNNPNHCSVCGKELDYEHRNNKACCDECRHILFQNAGKRSAVSNKNLRRSKNEMHFCELCENYFKDVKHNEPMFNGWDADVIIEDYKIAILWNGPWHYKQVIDDLSLKQIQNRDAIKIKEIEKCGYIPVVIKDDRKASKKFVKQKFDEFISEYI